jgi:hypothetical protein
VVAVLPCEASERPGREPAGGLFMANLAALDPYFSLSLSILIKLLPRNDSGFSYQGLEDIWRGRGAQEVGIVQEERKKINEWIGKMALFGGRVNWPFRGELAKNSGEPLLLLLVSQDFLTILESLMDILLLWCNFVVA